MFLRLKNRRRPLRNSPRFARRGVALSGFALTSLNSDYTESLLHFAFPNWLRQLRIVAYVSQNFSSLFGTKHKRKLSDLLPSLNRQTERTRKCSALSSNT